MTVLKDIQVRIARNTSGKVVAENAGARLMEYEKPIPDAIQISDSVERYIEAVAGQAFQIEVYIKPSFKFYKADGITVGLEIDDETVNFNTHYTKQQVEQKQKASEPLVISSVIRVEGARYFQVGFAFGSLHLDEKLEVDKDLVDCQAESQGRIIVAVSRYLRKELKKPRPLVGIATWYKATTSINFAKEIYKDKHIRQSVMPGSEVETKAPGLMEHDCLEEYRKHKCRELYFVFRYRDHMGLELLGCKPKGITRTTTVTEPISIEDDPNDPDIESNNAEKRDEGKCEEITQLRAENRRLQAFEREATELKHTVEGLKQENASMKAIKDQIAALTGTFGNTSSTPVPSTTTGIKSEVKKEYIKKEQSEGRPIPSSNGKDRPAKRPRTFVELD